MKKCPNCNAMMEDDALFCGECGTKFEVEDVSDQVEETAIPLEKKCIHCGESIEEDSAFCPFCGKPQTVEEVMPVEEVKKAPKKETIRNEVQKPKPLHEEPIENGRVIEVPDFTNEVIENNTSRTNRWIWAILLLIGLIGGAWYYYSQQNRGYSSSGEATAIDTTLVDTTLVDDNMANYSNARDFLEQFYKGENGDEGYIEQFVTANVLNKLKRDYEYDNCNDCLATWVFTAYPAGADYDLEGGPYISETEVKGRYRVDFKYSVRDGNRKEYRTRTVYLTVTEKDGKYLISDYETIEPERDMEAYEDVQEESKEIDTPSENSESHEVNNVENSQNTQVTSTQEKLQGSTFVVFATANELKEFGIIDDSGRLRSNFNKSFFTKIDPNDNKTIKLYSKSAKLLTSHPSNSYSLKLDDNKNYVLSITDPQLFWSLNKYLVILVN